MWCCSSWFIQSFAVWTQNSMGIRSKNYLLYLSKLLISLAWLAFSAFCLALRSIWFLQCNHVIHDFSLQNKSWLVLSNERMWQKLGFISNKLQNYHENSSIEGNSPIVIHSFSISLIWHNQLRGGAYSLQRSKVLLPPIYLSGLLPNWVW